MAFMADLEAARERLLRRLREEISDERVLAAMARVPREFFVSSDSRHLAYEDIPLPIGYGQTISQPFIVALMTQGLALGGNEKVLEVGTGSGYQTAVLAELVRRVITTERHRALADSARALLESLGYRNVEVKLAGKTLGWPEGAPYDAILVTAGSPQIPPSLLEQLAIGGRMVIPVGPKEEQDLLQVKKLRTRIHTVILGPCRFVPLVGEGAWSEERSNP